MTHDRYNLCLFLKYERFSPNFLFGSPCVIGRWTLVYPVCELDSSYLYLYLALYRIVTPMKLFGCTLEGKDLINKTLSTFHPKLTYVSRPYKKDNYKTYVALSNALQQDHGEDEIIM